MNPSWVTIFNVPTPFTVTAMGHPGPGAFVLLNINLGDFLMPSICIFYGAQLSAPLIYLNHWKSATERKDAFFRCESISIVFAVWPGYRSVPWNLFQESSVKCLENDEICNKITQLVLFRPHWLKNLMYQATRNIKLLDDHQFLTVLWEFFIKQLQQPDL